MITLDDTQLIFTHFPK